MFTQGLKSTSRDSERKRVAVLSNSPCTEPHTSMGSAEGQPRFLFGATLLLSLYNAEIHGGKARAGVGETFC